MVKVDIAHFKVLPKRTSFGVVQDLRIINPTALDKSCYELKEDDFSGKKVVNVTLDNTSYTLPVFEDDYSFERVDQNDINEGMCILVNYT